MKRLVYSINIDSSDANNSIKRIEERLKELNESAESSQVEINTLTQELKDLGEATDSIDASNSTKSVENLRVTYRKLLQELQRTEQGSERFRELAREAGNLKNQLDDATNSVRNLSGSPLQNLNRSFSSLRGNLLGLNIPGLIRNFGDMRSSIVGLGGGFANLTGTTINAAGAMRVFGVALAATGIGAFVVAIGVLISNFDTIKKSGGALGALFTGIGNVVSGVTRTVLGLSDAIGLTTNALATLDAQAKETGKDIEKTMSERLGLKDLSKELEDVRDKLTVLQTAGEEIDKQIVRTQLDFDRRIKNTKDVVAENRKLLEEELKTQRALITSPQRGITADERKAAAEAVEEARKLLKENQDLVVSLEKEKELVLRNLRQKQAETRNADNLKQVKERLDKELELTLLRIDEDATKVFKRIEKNMATDRMPDNVFIQLVDDLDDLDDMLSDIEEKTDNISGRRLSSWAQEEKRLQAELDYLNNLKLELDNFNLSENERLSLKLDIIKAEERLNVLFTENNVKTLLQGEQTIENLEEEERLIHSKLVFVQNLIDKDQERLDRIAQGVEEEKKSVWPGYREYLENLYKELEQDYDNTLLNREKQLAKNISNQEKLAGREASIYREQFKATDEEREAAEVKLKEQQILSIQERLAMIADFIEKNKELEIEQSEFLRELYEEQEFQLAFAQTELDRIKNENHLKELARIEKEKEARKRANQEITQQAITSAAFAANSIANISRARFDLEMALALDNEEKMEELRKQQFESEKALGIVSAIINTAQGVTNAIANTPGPPWVGIAMAAVVGALGAVEIATIAAQQYNPSQQTGSFQGPSGNEGDGVLEASQLQPAINFVGAGTGANISTAGGGTPQSIEFTGSISVSEINQVQNTISLIEGSSTLGGG